MIGAPVKIELKMLTLFMMSGAKNDGGFYKRKS